MILNGFEINNKNLESFENPVKLPGSIQGAGKNNFTRTVLDLKHSYKFEIFAIFEPRISGRKAALVISKLGFSNYFVVEANGFSGGLWLLWNDARVKLKLIADSKQAITPIIDVDIYLFVLTVVYASPVITLRKKLWHYLDLIRGRL
ncbi:hypothetical protein ACOSQ2_005543 [Xanthoceras sorbifolium]